MSKTYVLYPFVPKRVSNVTMVEIICQGCKEPFQVAVWLRNKRKYCCFTCKHSDPKYRLMKKVVKQENGCWNWTGGINKTSGYGYIGAFGRHMGPHQLSYLLHKGAIPDGCWVLHTCVGNRICVNPDHLYLGSAKDNVGDMIRQGRFRVAKGSESGRSKLTEEQVRFILSMKDVMKQRELSAKFNVSQGAISYIWSRKNWKHLNIDSPPTV